MAKQPKYLPTEEAKKNPRLYEMTRGKGDFVGIGGKYVVPEKKPKPKKEFPEATAAQYKILYEDRQLHNLVQKVEAE